MTQHGGGITNLEINDITERHRESHNVAGALLYSKIKGRCRVEGRQPSGQKGQDAQRWTGAGGGEQTTGGLRI